MELSPQERYELQKRIYNIIGEDKCGVDMFQNGVKRLFKIRNEELTQIFIEYAYLAAFYANNMNTIKKNFVRERFEIRSLKGFCYEDDIFMCGGAVEKRMRSDYESYVKSKEFLLSDIDLFVLYSRDQYETVKRVIETIQKNTVGLMFRSFNAITIVTPHDVIQIILSHYSSIEEILYSFDFAHIQCAYNGKDVIYTYPAEYSCRTKKTFINRWATNLKEYRLIKAYLNGYNVKDYDLDEQEIRELAKKHKKSIYKDLRWNTKNKYKFARYCFYDLEERPMRLYISDTLKINAEFINNIERFCPEIYMQNCRSDSEYLIESFGDQPDA